jgi:nitrite reductase/ring-hydroxylating ferredoxin subunit
MPCTAMLELCRLADIPDGGARGFAVEGPGLAQRLVVVRRGDAVFGYVNSCPHVPTRLDYTPGEFLDESGCLLLCQGHGARFRVEDGLCVEGPCEGEALFPAPVRVADGRVWLDRAGAAVVDEISKVLSDLR